MKKALLMVAVIGIATLSSAQQNRRVGARDIVREAQRVQELINREVEYLTLRQIDQVSDKLQEIRQIIRGGGNPNPVQPNPPPFPNPYPPTPYYPVVSVRGEIENAAYSFDVTDLMGLHSQCVSFVNSKNLVQADDIKVSVNFGPIQVLRNSQSWWKGANQICQQIITVAQSNQLPSSQTNQSIVYGTIEAQEFSLTGFGKADLFRQCESFLTAKNLTQVDEITRVTNFGPEKVLKNSASWWRGTLEICQQVLGEVQ